MLGQNSQTVINQRTLLDLRGINWPKQNGDLAPTIHVRATDEWS